MYMHVHVHDGLALLYIPQLTYMYSNICTGMYMNINERSVIHVHVHVYYSGAYPGF